MWNKWGDMLRRLMSAVPRGTLRKFHNLGFITKLGDVTIGDISATDQLDHVLDFFAY